MGERVKGLDENGEPRRGGRGGMEKKKMDEVFKKGKNPGGGMGLIVLDTWSFGRSLLVYSVTSNTNTHTHTLQNPPKKKTTCFVPFPKLRTYSTFFPKEPFFGWGYPPAGVGDEERDWMKTENPLRGVRGLLKREGGGGGEG